MFANQAIILISMTETSKQVYYYIIYSQHKSLSRVIEVTNED